MAWSETDDNRVREFCRTTDVGKLTKCPKCGLGDGDKSEMMLANFCTHKYCPFREWRLAKDAAERPKPEAITPEQEDTIYAAYLGVCTLQTMCRKAGLALAEQRSKELLVELGTAFPFIPKRVGNSALRETAK